MTEKIYRLSRRMFLADLGRGVMAVALFGSQGCADSQGPFDVCE